MEGEDRKEGHVPVTRENSSEDFPVVDYDHDKEFMTGVGHFEVSKDPVENPVVSHEPIPTTTDKDQVRFLTGERVIDTEPTEIHEYPVGGLENTVGQTPMEIDLTQDATKDNELANSEDHVPNDIVIEDVTTNTSEHVVTNLSSTAERLHDEPHNARVSGSENTLMTVPAADQDNQPKQEMSFDNVIDLSKWPKYNPMIVIDDDVVQISESIIIPDSDETRISSTTLSNSKPIFIQDDCISSPTTESATAQTSLAIAPISKPVVIQDDNNRSPTTNTASSADHRRILLTRRKPMTVEEQKKRLQIQQELIQRHQTSLAQNRPAAFLLSDTPADAQLNARPSNVLQRPPDTYPGEEIVDRPSSPGQGVQHSTLRATAVPEPWDDEEEDPLREYQAALPRAMAAEANFTTAKQKYKAAKRAGTTTREDEINYLTLSTEEKIRLKRFNDLQVRASQALARAAELPEDSGTDDDSLFISTRRKDGTSIADPVLRSDYPGLPSMSTEAPKQRRKGKQFNKVSEEAISAGMEEERIKEMRKAKRGRGTGVTKSSTKGSKGKVKEAKVTKLGKKGPQKSNRLFKNFNSLFTSNVYTDGNRNSGITLPTSTQKDKRKALNEIVAAIPLADKRIVTQDANALILASKTLGPRQCRRDTSGNWKFNGMRSLLRPHQVLAAANMKDREDGITQPAGGILADEMGFGKTVTTIATIIANPPPRGDEQKTTLIVVPASILHQWQDEIWLHGERDRVGKCVVYHVGQRIDGFSSEDIYKDCDIILTTYGEVVRSYPKFNPPQELGTFHQKREWFKRQLEERRGVLHRLNFYRIVLDEAQVIKNYQSLTSKAVRALDGKFRWAISGTPIQNAVDELYPYFKFLRVKYSGTIDVFRKNFCKRGTDICNERVQAVLKSFMIRRDYSDTLMGEKIVSLPENHVTTVAVTFNATERAVYDTVQKRFIERINSYCRAGDIKLKYNNVLTMLLTLRQLCSHLYLVQDTIEEIFLLEDFERLWATTANEAATSDPPRSRDMLTEMSRLIGTQDRTPGTQVEPANQQDEALDQVLQPNRPLVFNFRQHLRDLATSANFVELRARSVCARCRDVPLDPQLSSCQHLYCKECLRTLSYESSVRNEDQNECLACGALFEKAVPCPALKELGYDDAGLRAPDSSNEDGSQAGSPTKPSRRWIESNRSVTPSSKAAAALAQITRWLQEDPACKIVVFTQFRLMITVLGKLCKDRELGYCVFHGAMTYQSRNNVIKEFRDKEETHIMIASLKCGGVGLNLTMANRVICIDLWWNSPVEQQAFCRVYRIGQTQETYVTRIVVRETVDDRLLRMQEEKTRIIGEAMGEEGKRMGKLSVKELMRLFGTLSDDNDDEDGPEFIIVEDDPDEIPGVDEFVGQEQPKHYRDVIMLD